MAATFIGRCKGCKGRVRVEAPVVKTVVAQLGYGRKETRFTRELPNGAKVEGYDRFFVQCLCGKHAEFRKINGRVTEHVCGSKCMGSTGFVCDCSCGGKNHGKAFAA